MPLSSRPIRAKAIRICLVLLSFFVATALAYFTLKSTGTFVGKTRVIASVALGIATILPSYLSLISAEKSTNRAEELHGNLKEHAEELHVNLKQSLGDAEKDRARAEELYA